MTIQSEVARPDRRPHQRLLDLVFPPRCVGEGCARPGAWICDRCWPRTPWLPPDRCILCGDSLATGKLCASCLRRSAVGPWLPVNMTAVASFEGVAKQAVYELKFRRHWDIATILGPLMATRVNVRDATIVPVPLHWRRRRERGFNQSQLLANQIGHMLGMRVDTKRLRRTRHTSEQTALDAARRRLNVAGAFAWVGEAFEGSILLVDDVYTTGATLNECANVVRHAGANRVEGVVFAIRQQPGQSHLSQST